MLPFSHSPGLSHIPLSMGRRPQREPPANLPVQSRDETSAVSPRGVGESKAGRKKGGERTMAAKETRPRNDSTEFGPLEEKSMVPCLTAS